MENIVPNLSSNLSKVWRKVLDLERTLFPALQEMLRLETLSAKEQKLIRILDFSEIDKHVTVVKVTNPPKDREQIARAFIAKSVYNLQTTRDLIDRLKIDRTLRILCGWRYESDIPSESKFSRVFKELSEQRIAERAHERFIETYLSDSVFHYSANDATAIELREKPVSKQKSDSNLKKRRKGRPKKGEKRAPKKPTILEKQREMTSVQEMLSLLPCECSIGIKKNAKGYMQKWQGGKLHIATVDGDIPVAAIYTGAGVHDNSVALPLMGITSQRVSYLYDLMDAAYDADIIREYSLRWGHHPIIDTNPRNNQALKAKIALRKEESVKFKRLGLHFDSHEHHYGHRNMVERVNAYLKDDFGCGKIYYQGSMKVASVLQFAILSICIHQTLRLVT